jgi:hypothetical protein
LLIHWFSTMSETRQVMLRSKVLTVGILASCLVIVFVSLHAAYPSVLTTVKFLGYLLVFNLLPGFVGTRLILPDVKEAGIYLIFALGAGIVINTLAVTLLWSIGQLHLLFILPALAAGIAILRFRRLSEHFTDTQIRGNALYWVLGTLFLCFTALLGIGYIYSDVTADSYSAHAAFQGVIVRGLQAGWPPPNLLLPGVAWSYNYAAHLWLLGINTVTGLSIDVLVTRYGPVSLAGASAALMLAFGRQVVGLRWSIAALPVISVFWVIGIPPITGALFASFMPFGANLILSPFLSFLVFFLTLTFVVEQRSTTRLALAVRVATIATLAFLATGARGVSTPILVCALALRWVVFAWRKEGWLHRNLLDLVAAIIGFAAGLRFFFTVGTGFSGTGAVKFTGQPFSFLSHPDQSILTLAHTLMGRGVAALPAAVVAFVVIAIFQAAFLTPALPTAFVQFRKRMSDADVLLIGSAIAGIAGFFLTEAPGLSHLSFLYFANICLSLVGGEGLQHITVGADRRVRRWQPLETVALAMIVVLAGLHLEQLPVRAIAWVCDHWSASALSLARFSPEPLPRLDVCVRDQDANLLASASRASPAAVVIVLPSGNNHCAPFWWVVHSPVQTVSAYLLTYIPGRATDQRLQNEILSQKSHMDHAVASAAQGALDTEDVVAIAKTLARRGPVFIIAPRELSVQANSALQMVAADGSYALWRIRT